MKFKKDAIEHILGNQEKHRVVARILGFVFLFILLFLIFAGYTLCKLRTLDIKLREFVEAGNSIREIIMQVEKLQFKQHLILKKILRIKTQDNTKFEDNIPESLEIFKEHGEQIDRKINEAIKITEKSITITDGTSKKFEHIDELLFKLHKEHKKFQEKSLDVIYRFDCSTIEQILKKFEEVENKAKDTDHLNEKIVAELEIFMEKTIETVESDEISIIRRVTIIAVVDIIIAIIFGVYMVLSILKYISHRKLLEDELRKHKEHLEKIVTRRTIELTVANEQLQKEIAEKIIFQKESIRRSHLISLGELAAGIAHEVNNPINGIINYARILAKKSESGSREEDFANEIISEGRRIAIIVKNLLSFARGGSDKKSPVQFKKTFLDVFSLTGMKMEKDDILIKIDIPDKLPKILAHPIQLQQVYLNILSNARYALNKKYPSPHNDKIIEISAKEIVSQNKPFLQIVFYDHGFGIPSDIQDEVMNPFFSTKPPGEGTGLGLSISYGIIKKYGGEIFIDSIEKEYTKIIINLPVVEE